MQWEESGAEILITKKENPKPESKNGERWILDMVSGEVGQRQSCLNPLHYTKRAESVSKRELEKFQEGISNQQVWMMDGDFYCLQRP